MNFTLMLETDDATALRAISTAAAMIEYYSEATGDAPAYALTDALTTMAWIADALTETLDDHAGVGFELSTLVTDGFRERLARRLQALATTLLEPPPTEEAKNARIAEARQMVADALANGVSPATSERHHSLELDWFGLGDGDDGDGDDLFCDAIPA